MNYINDYKKAYEAKKKPEGIYLMNTFCSEIEESACVEDIPDLLRLYYDRAITREQNEFITEVLTKIVKENPKEAAEKTVNNIYILHEENADDCIAELILIFLSWHKEATSFLLDALKSADSNNSNYIISAIQDLADEEEDEDCQAFLIAYGK